MHEKNISTPENTDELDGRYLLFHVEEKLYGIPLSLVLEIIQTDKITPLPLMADYVKGIINLRGKIVPVIDIRLKFGLTEKPYDDKTCVIIAEIQDMQLGLIVDSVSEVVSLPREQLAAPPSAGAMASWYVDSIAEIGGNVVLNLDFDKLLQDDLTAAV